MKPFIPYFLLKHFILVTGFCLFSFCATFEDSSHNKCPRPEYNCAGSFNWGSLGSPSGFYPYYRNYPLYQEYHSQGYGGYPYYRNYGVNQGHSGTNQGYNGRGANFSVPKSFHVPAARFHNIGSPGKWKF
ncbi:MAG: hypothetical protein K8R21_01595 [Leptospira sp.]|nr:hypothetical protein [Leptospira sp.]